MFNIVLVQPEIPQNCGNIARTCAATGARLHMIEPLGFELSDRYLKRAGMDYWQILQYFVYADWQDFLQKNNPQNMYFASTKAKNNYAQIQYPPDSYFVFGRETKGLDEQLLFDNYDRCIRIPMGHDIRSLNLANSAAIVLYEALRQHGFLQLEQTGKLTKF